MKELSIEEKAYDGNYKAYTELINRLEDVKNAIKKQNYGIAMDILCKPYPDFQVTTHSELKESEDERIKKLLVEAVTQVLQDQYCSNRGVSKEKVVAYLEKQGNLMKALQISNAKIGELVEKNYYLKEQFEKQSEHTNFLNKIQIGDKVTRNEDGVLVNISQLNRVAKKDEKQGQNNMGISEATKKKLEDNLNKALEKETPESCNEFLDKQGEQKPIKEHNACEFCEDRYGCVNPCSMKLIEEEKSTDKIKPKFKIGDIIRHKKLGFTCRITAVDTEYSVSDCCGTHLPFDRQDAYELVEQKPVEEYNIAGIGSKHATGKLAEKIKEFESFKQGKQKPVFEMKTPEKSLGIDSNTYNKIVDECIYGEQKSAAWSEEDKDILFRTINDLKFLKDTISIDPKYAVNIIDTEREINWLKSIKDRVQPQPKQEWSEEDYNKIETIVCHLDNTDNEDMADVLRNIRDKYCHITHQSTWKPSDEQMDALHYVTNFDYGGHKATLVSLYEQLKKLKG